MEIKQEILTQELTAEEQEMNKIANMLSMWDKKSESSEISFSDEVIFFKYNFFCILLCNFFLLFIVRLLKKFFNCRKTLTFVKFINKSHFI